MPAMPSPSSPPPIDRILEAIRAEARSRGSRERERGFSSGGDVVMAGTHGMLPPPVRHVRDLLALPLDVFLATAYRELLGREADAAGAAHYQRQLLRGALTRAEVVGRLALSPEARRRGALLPGALSAFAFATFYRLPLLGPAAALVAWALRLPAHWQDRARIEQAALATGGWMKR
jgi:hypothetical protein